MKSAEKDVKAWIADRIKRDQIDKYLKGGPDFINDERIEEILKNSEEPDPSQLKDILDKSLSVQTLSLEETASLINVRNPDMRNLMRKRAVEVKKKVYDNRIVTFAPLYLNNLCVNNCLYCGFRKDNVEAKRRILSSEEIRREAEALAGKIGHKRLIVVYGESPETGVDYIRDSIHTIYGVKVKTKNGYGQIRRVNVNAPPLSIEELEILRDVGIGTYQVFQETYHKDTYRKVHPEGTIKGDYLWRLYCMHRALEAGVDDVGIGALFGLYDWRFEVLGLVSHAIELERVFNIGPHTVSFPRLEPAANAPATDSPKFRVGDADFQHLITVIRLAIPYTGMIITARENPEIRRESIRLGCTQTDASTRIGIGAYSREGDEQEALNQQFMLGDTRTLDELIREFSEDGYITSFCTAGYRCGRTGECIMDMLRSGEEGKFCKLNAILTFREWLDDFASPATKEAGEKVIRKELSEVKEKMPKFYDKLYGAYERISNGERDLYF